MAPMELLNGANGTSIGAYGDSVSCADCRWRSQSPLAPMATIIGENGDRHLALIGHGTILMAPLYPLDRDGDMILSSQSPFTVSGFIGNTLAPIDLMAQLTPMATMMIHRRHRRHRRHWR